MNTAIINLADEEWSMENKLVIMKYLFKQNVQNHEHVIVTKMHSNEAILFSLLTGKAWLFTDTCICNNLW